MWVGSAFGRFSENRFRERIRTVSLIFAFIYSTLILRLFYLQIIKGGDFSEISEMNRTQILYLRAPRGNFLDRHGNILVTNRPSWSLVYSVPSGAAPERREIEARLEPFLKNYDSRWKKRLLKAFQTKKMVRLVENVPPEAAFGMREMGILLSGARMEMEFTRNYSSASAIGHLVGYLGEIDERELNDELWVQRKAGDMIGKMGLEKVLDEKIRGHDGGTVVEVDSLGRLKRVIQELPYQIGNSVQLTIDGEAQKKAVELLMASPTKRGAAIALDVQTGAILTWVSSPAFDPTQSFVEQSNNPNYPFFDRVYKGNYPPGSLFKIITALAGLEKNIIKLLDTVDCVGYVMLEDKSVTGPRKERRFGCWKKHGQVNFWKAVAESCDTYFYQLGERLGSNPIYEMARQFGLGDSVQNIFPGEAVGTVPNAVWKRQQKKGGWSTGDTYNMSIGQGFVTSSPLQMAYMMAAVGSRGELYRPFVVSRISDPTNKTVRVAQKEFVRKINLKNESWDVITRAMGDVVEDGTGRLSGIPYLDVHGKTGTAQNPHGTDHAWFGAFAGYPGEKPQVAVCIFVENGGNGSSTAAPIAKEILKILLPDKGS